MHFLSVFPLCNNLNTNVNLCEEVDYVIDVLLEWLNLILFSHTFIPCEGNHQTLIFVA